MSSDLYSKTIKNTFTNRRQYITGFTDTGTIDFTLSGNDITAIVNPDLVIDSLIISNSNPPVNSNGGSEIATNAGSITDTSGKYRVIVNGSENIPVPQ